MSSRLSPHRPAKQTTVPAAGCIRQRLSWSLCVACIRAHMEFLASDALRGRGSATADELVAATYVASELRAYGIAPAGDDGGYLQRGGAAASQNSPRLHKSPSPNPAPAEKSVTWNWGKEFTSLIFRRPQFSGPLRVINVDEELPQAAGAVVLILGNDRHRQRAKASSLAGEGSALRRSSPPARSAPPSFSSAPDSCPHCQ